LKDVGKLAFDTIAVIACREGISEVCKLRRVAFPCRTDNHRTGPAWETVPSLHKIGRKSACPVR